ncbi:HDOD domain-containing protein [Desulfurivibrio alkaliphilus]|uniref:Metal dependent phosphohydrolase n=1 Tax=Desulfurivibrio alkaliphilus (strain DSM 19089 / UNIQEM U267 / AHT2) TaxID=589865 RepID=D6Z1B7_DESAT|nr:HDOD domain-containing protein [Desulfurivibrio alkaliphilus]ADH85372.1 metal dependent phosphohydrolase [Desulfurivibrio alkaliphilus AHT 2]
MKSKEQKAAIDQAIGRLPRLSAAAIRLLRLVQEPDHGLAEVVAIVKNDALLTSRVLMVVNSPVYGRLNKITGIDHAVSLLGEDLVVGAAMKEAAGLLLDKKLDGYAAEEGELWRHNLKTALAAKILARQTTGKVAPELAFTCGLLHDLGKAVISDYLGDNAGRIRRAVEQGKVADFLAAERVLLGIDHAEAGFTIATKWSLPVPLPEVCRFHHTPGQAPPMWRELLYIVHLADIVAMLSGVGTGADTLQYHLDRNYEAYLTLDEKGLPMVVLQVEEEFSKVAEVF